MAFFDGLSLFREEFGRIYGYDANNNLLSAVDDQNHVATVKDAGGNTVRYTWDLPKDLMTALTDAKGNVTSYAYDSADRLEIIQKALVEMANRIIILM